MPAPLSADLPMSARVLIAEAEQCEGQGRWHAARDRYEQVLQELNLDRHQCDMRRVMRRVARCLIEEGSLERAIEVLTLARILAQECNDPVGVAHAMNLEAIVAQQCGNLPMAEQHYHAARALAWQARDTLLVAMLDQNLGTVANIRGDLAEAKFRYTKSLSAYRALRMPGQAGPLHNNLGMLHTDLGQWREAERHFTEAVRSARSCIDAAGELRVHANRAELYVAQGRYRKAKRLCRRVVAMERQQGACAGGWLAEAFKNLGVAHRETGLPEAADHCFTRALVLAEQREDPLLTAEILREVAVLHHGEGRNQETLAALSRAHALFTRLTAGRDLRDVDRQLRELERQFIDIVQRWGESIESADSYTQGHCQRVAEFGTLLASDAGIDPNSLLWFRMGALLHDVGKVVVPRALLNKRGALTPAEMQVIREHPVAGEKLIANSRFPWDIAPMVRHHHERWDGTGYPDGLSGQEIPLAARILCIADVYDALTSTRSYREAYAVDVAMAIMEAEAGKAFDPGLLRVFLDSTLPALRGGATLHVSHGGTARVASEVTPLARRSA